MATSILDGERETVKAAAETCGVHVNTIFRWARVGHRGRRLRLVRFGGRTFVRRSDLAEFVEAISDPPAEAKKGENYEVAE